VFEFLRPFELTNRYLRPFELSSVSILHSFVGHLLHDTASAALKDTKRMSAQEYITAQVALPANVHAGQKIKIQVRTMVASVWRKIAPKHGHQSNTRLNGDI
jgi:hypothetical protein